MIHNYTIEIINSQAHVTTKCTACGKTYTFVIPAEDTESFMMWVHGTSNELIQNVIPHADATTREHLISGFCEECQKEIFGE